MAGSLNIAKPFGISVKIHWSFWLIIVYVVYLRLSSGGGLADAAEGAGFVMAVFLCVVLHELGHALAARGYGIPTRDITLLPIGGVARLARMPTNPWQEFVVAIAGPMVNVMIALVLVIGLALFGGLTLNQNMLNVGLLEFLNRLMVVNVLLVVFNMIPAIPMDGGRILRAVLGMLSVPYATATKVAAIIGRVIAVGFGILGLVTGNPMLILIGLFVFFGAGAEVNAAQAREAILHARVGNAMLTRFSVLPGSVSVGEAARILAGSTQPVFPVADPTDDRLLGLVTAEHLARSEAEGRSDDALAAIALLPAPAVEATQPLQTTWQRMRDEGVVGCLVTEGSQVVGLLLNADSPTAPTADDKASTEPA